jgi:hypothetical protein
MATNWRRVIELIACLLMWLDVGSVNQRDWTGAAQALRRWIDGGGKVLSGLVLRREVEMTLILSRKR